MAQSGYSVLSLYYSTTASTAPTAGNLVLGELAINTTDGVLYYKDTGGVVQKLATKGGVGTSSTTQVLYNSSGLVVGSANMTFNGTTFTTANDASISGLTVGKGGGAVAGNTAIGYQSLNANTTGTNTALGYQSLLTITTGTGNCAFGNSALKTTTANYNNAFGENALVFTTSGTQNSGFGTSALQTNTTGSYNVAMGYSALFSNTTASNNTAVGYQAGYSLTTGGSNVIMGYQALDAATTTSSSTVIGNRAGGAITTGNNNTIVGADAGASLTTGSGNCFIGATGTYASGELITTGSKNTIVGSYNGNLGGLDIRTLSNYIVLSDGDGNIRQFTNNSGFTKITNAGASASLSTSGTFHEVISDAAGDPALIAVSTNASFSSNCLQADIARNTTNNSFYAISYFNRGATAFRFRVADSGNVTNTNNSYGAISDIKLKENIVDASPKLEDLCKVKVRQYNLKSDPDHKQIGVVAQELEEVFAGLVEESADKDGEGNDLGTTTKTVKYSVFVPMLIKAIQELKAEVDSLKQQLGK
jgi:trimeric autotransporter adhesin